MLDAAYDVVIPHKRELTDVRVIQDAYFQILSRKKLVFLFAEKMPHCLGHDGCCKKVIVPPFEISVFPDPVGSFTTAAAMVVCTERLKDKFQTDLNKKIMTWR